jgi:hypothetical protein
VESDKDEEEWRMSVKIRAWNFATALRSGDLVSQFRAVSNSRTIHQLLYFLVVNIEMHEVKDPDKDMSPFTTYPMVTLWNLTLNCTTCISDIAFRYGDWQVESPI